MPLCLLLKKILRPMGNFLDIPNPLYLDSQNLQWEQVNRYKNISLKMCLKSLLIIKLNALKNVTFQQLSKEKLSYHMIFDFDSDGTIDSIRFWLLLQCWFLVSFICFLSVFHLSTYHCRIEDPSNIKLTFCNSGSRCMMLKRLRACYLT